MNALQLGHQRSTTSGRWLTGLLSAALVVQLFLASAASAAALSEQEKIDALVQAVETRSDLKFERLGSVHSSSEAATMLRTKLRFAGSRVQTAEQFIVHIASATQSGSTYYVIYPDGKRQPSGEFLRQELSKLTKVSMATRTAR